MGRRWTGTGRTGGGWMGRLAAGLGCGLWLGLSGGLSVRAAEGGTVPVTPPAAAVAEPADPLGPMVPVTAAAQKRAERLDDQVDFKALAAENRPAFSLLLSRVDPGLQADKAGLKVGDRITALFGQPVTSANAFEGTAQRYKQYTITIWSLEKGYQDYTFQGLMGVQYKDCWEAASAYLQSADRDPAWDKWVVVAAQNWEDHPATASAALVEARKAGYRGHLLPALRLIMATQSGRYQAALDAAARLPDYLPAGDRRVVYFHLFMTYVALGQIDNALTLDRDHPGLSLAEHFWRPQALVKREAKLTREDRLLIQRGRLAAETVQDYSGKLKPIRQMNLDKLQALAGEEKLDVDLSAPETPAFFVFGPPNANPAVGFTLRIPKAAKGTPAGKVFLSVIDTDTGMPLNQLRIQTDGWILPKMLDCPEVGFNGDQAVLLDADNRIEVAICGPWCEYWLNDHVVARVLMDNPAGRHLAVELDLAGGKFTLSQLTYKELKAPGQPAAPGLSWTPHPQGGPGLAPTPAAPTAAGAKWFFQEWVGTYIQYGHRDAAWDAAAVAGLTQYARVADAHGAAEDVYATWKLLEQAVTAGCDDPLVCYAAAQLTSRLIDAGDPQPVRRTRGELLEWLVKPGAPKLPALEFVVNRCFASYELATGYDYLAERARGRLPRMYQLAGEMAGDKSMPVGEKMVLLTPLADLLGADPADWLQATEPLLAAVERAAPDSSVSHALRGYVLNRAAWSARGDGWAGEVEEEGGKKFGELLPKAKTELLKAYALDSTNGAAMTEMIECGMGLGESVEQLDKYFEQAIAADPNNIGAYHNRMWALMPRWGGDHNLMAGVARQGVIRYKQNPPAYSFDVPLQILNLHEMFSNDYSLPGETDAERSRLRAEYWTTTGVWREVHDTFELILKQRPNDRFVQSRYMLYAAKCQQWDTVERLQKAMQGEVCTGVFGGKARYFVWWNLVAPRLKAQKDAEKNPPPQAAPKKADGGGGDEY